MFRAKPEAGITDKHKKARELKCARGLHKSERMSNKGVFTLGPGDRNTTLALEGVLSSASRVVLVCLCCREVCTAVIDSFVRVV